MSSKALESSKIIQQYNKQLEVENLAKNHQIQSLRKQIDLITLSSRLQALNSQPACEECLRKQQQIDTLIKAIKSLRRSYSIPHRGVVNQVAEQQQQSPRQIQVIQSLDQNKEYNDQAAPLFLHQQSMKIMNKYDSKSKTQFSIQSVQVQGIEDIKQQVHSIRQQNQILKKRLSFFAKKVIQLQQINRILRDQIVKIKLQETARHGHQEFSVNPYIKPQLVVVQNYDKKTPVFAAIRSQVVKTSHNITQNRNSRNKKCIDKIKINPSSRNDQNSKNQCSPRVQKSSRHQRNQKGSRNQRYQISKIKQTIKTNYTGYQSPLEVSINSKKYDYSKRYKSKDQDLLQQRRKSLQHKIKILEGENRRLRTQMYENNY